MSLLAWPTSLLERTSLAGSVYSRTSQPTPPSLQLGSHSPASPLSGQHFQFPSSLHQGTPWPSKTGRCHPSRGMQCWHNYYHQKRLVPKPFPPMAHAQWNCQYSLPPPAGGGWFHHQLPNRWQVDCHHQPRWRNYLSLQSQQCLPRLTLPWYALQVHRGHGSDHLPALWGFHQVLSPWCHCHAQATGHDQASLWCSIQWYGKKKTIKNCPIKSKHITNAHAVFNLSIAGVPGKTICCNPKQVEAKSGCIPDNFHQLHQLVVLTADVMFVIGIAFLTTLSWKLRLAMVKQLPTRMAKQLNIAH